MRLLHEARELFLSFLGFLYPCFCCLCNGDTGPESPVLCNNCQDRLPALQTPVSHTGRDIVGFEGPVYFERTVAAFGYDGTIQKLVHMFKYRGYSHLGGILAVRLAEVLQCIDMGRFQTIIPVPLHRLRYRERGYNQADIIARTLGKRLRVPVDPKVLKRVRYTQPQAKMDKAERAVNLKGAFAVKKNNGLKDAAVLLVDDVFTTGSTLNEAAKAIKQAGAADITAVTLARVEVKKADV